jgi:hypothetical protein
MPFEALLQDNFWPDQVTGAWTVPTLAQREILRRRRAKPHQLSLGLDVVREQMIYSQTVASSGCSTETQYD